MNIVIAGAGKVGYTVAEQLNREKHDLTIIENDHEKLTRVTNEMDVYAFEGNAGSLSVLKDAGVGNADVFIAVTGEDEVNMVSCLMAKRLGAKHTMARIRNPEYMKDEAEMKEMLGLSLALNPDKLAAEEISQILQFPTAARMESFPYSNLHIITYKVPIGSILHQLDMTELGRHYGGKILICAIERGEKIIIPNGQDQILEGDHLSVVGTQHDLRHFFMKVHAYKQPVKNAIIMGGSRLGVYLSILLDKAGMDVTLIEKDPARCEYLADLLRQVDVLCADGSKSSFLHEIGIEDADAFVTLTGSDEENIILSMYASKVGVKKVITKINEAKFEEMVGDAFLDTAVSPKILIAQKIIGRIRAYRNSARSSTVEALYYLSGDRVEALEFIVGPESHCINIPLRDLKIRSGILLASVVRDGKGHVPDGKTEIREGDRVVVVTAEKGITDLDSILED